MDTIYQINWEKLLGFELFLETFCIYCEEFSSSLTDMMKITMRLVKTQLSGTWAEIVVIKAVDVNINDFPKHVLP